MRLVYVPEELTPLYLLELREIPVFFRDRLQDEVQHRYDAGQWEEALAFTEQLSSAAMEGHDEYTAALITLYKADMLRRLQRWAEALEHTYHALTRLHWEVTQVAGYNRAVALYFIGLLYFILRADAKTLRAFTEAQEILNESERYWGFENNVARVAACRDMSRWMSTLLALPSRMPPGEWVMIVPVYELENQTLLRTGVTTVTPFQIMLPAEQLGDYLPSNYIPLEIEPLPFLQLRPDARYMALKILTDGDFIEQSRVGDIILVEVVSPAPITHVAAPTLEAPFVRRPDGRIRFAPHKQTGGGWIPRVLIREEEEEEES
ncbi:MAG TPA: hypothetical protein PLJ78_16565 [Anaerolineae bacterium]|nr:hypothetical protein [Anaerolineae bacterium]HQK15546.1 hypothetical protein [Anaerolineae bacterium]